MPTFLTRRECLGAAALLGATRSAFAGPAFRGPLGVQLYTVRDALKTAPAETIQAIASLGYRQVEATLNSDFASLLPLLKKNHSGCGELPLRHAAHHRRLERAQRCARFHLERRGRASARRGNPVHGAALSADGRARRPRFLQAPGGSVEQRGAACQKSGMTLAYHNHAFEFQPVEGVRPFDILMERTDPKLVKLELDVFWVSMAGQDPVAMLKQYPGRVALLHLKDKAAGAPVQFSEDVAHETYKEVGSGSLDFPAILKAAKDAGVQHYFVEQDFCPGNPIDSLRKSYQFLRS